MDKEATMEMPFYHSKRKDIEINMTVSLHDGELQFSGYDFGEFVAKSPVGQGGDEYEYYLKLDEENTKKAFEALGVADKSDKEKLQFIVDTFKKDQGFSGFEEYCEKHDIEAKFFSWP